MDKKNLFPIGAVAKMFHISVSTLRYYEKIELLMPEYTDSETGYRYYSLRQFEQLNAIRYLRVLDTPLEQISDFLKNRNLDNVQSILMQQRANIAKKRQELEIMEKKLDNRLQQLNNAMNAELDKIEISEIPPRRIACIDHRLEIASHLDLEAPMRRLEQYEREAIVFLGKVGVGIFAQKLKSGNFSEYDMIFVLLDNEDDYRGRVVSLPKNTSITVKFCGSHAQAPKYYRKLFNYISDNNLQIAGFSSEITMIDYGYTNDTEQFVTEIQIPVTKQESGA